MVHPRRNAAAVHYNKLPGYRTRSKALYTSILPKQYEKTVYISTQILTGPVFLAFEAEKQENKGKIDVEVEFASPSCYFNSGRS